MPNGGEALRPDELGTYRKSDIARLEASHVELLATCGKLTELFLTEAVWPTLNMPAMETVREASALITKVHSEMTVHQF